MDLERALRTESNFLNDQLDNYIREFSKKLNDQIEAACEKALASGKDGVRVTHSSWENSYTTGENTYTVEVTSEVPFGEIHYINI